MSVTNGNQQGFTLLEVLVALAILTIAMGALIKSGTEATGNAEYLRDKTLAHWVALNRINELQLARDWPATGESRGSVEMAGRDWRWEARISDTFDKDIRRLEVEVRLLGDPEDANLERLTAFLSRPSEGSGTP